MLDILNLFKKREQIFIDNESIIRYQNAENFYYI